MKGARRIIIGPQTAVVVILLAGWFLRIHDLEASSLWLDEVRSFERALLPDWQAGREALIRANHAPLYEWLVLRTWLNLGSTEFLARFPGAILSMLAICVTYALASSLFKRKAVGLWAMLFLMLSSLYLTFGRWIRPYALLSFLLALSIFCLWRAMSTGRAKYWLAFGTLAAGALYTHYFAAFTLIALGLFVITRSAIERDWVLIRNWALSSALTALLFLPWLSSFRAEIGDGAVEWIEPLRLATLLELPSNLVTAELFVEPFWLVATAAVWLTLAIGFVTWIRRRSGPAERWSYPFLIIASAGTVLLAVLVSIFKPLIVARYFIGVLPAFCLLLAYTVVYARPRGLALGLGISILVVSLMSGSMVVTRQTTENWKAVAAHIEANSSSGDDLVLIDQAQVWSVPFDFYYRGELEAGFMSGELSDAQTVQDAVDANCPCDRLWLVQSVRRTSGESLVYEPQSDYGGYKILARKTFHENLIRDRLAIDLWLLGEEGN